MGRWVGGTFSDSPRTVQELITLIHHLIIFVSVLFKVAVFNWSFIISDFDK